jgi:sugar lactone lactonase YvrE
VVVAGVIVAQPAIVDSQTITFTAPALGNGRSTVTVQTRGGLAQSSLFVESVPLRELPRGYITTIVGGTTFAGDGSSAASAVLRYPMSTALDAAGNLYIADSDNHRVRRIDAVTGTITTVAGTGLLGFYGDGGPATAAQLASPYDVAIDAAGNLFISELGYPRVRKITASTGIITTVAGTGFDGFSGDGGPATAARLWRPHGIALDASGNLFIADRDNHRVRRVDAATGVITTVAGTDLLGFSGDGGPATSARLHSPEDVAIDASGNLVIVDSENHRVRRVAPPNGTITTIAGSDQGGFSGDGGVATAARLYYPHGLAFDSSGNLLICDYGRVRKVAGQTGIISTVAGNGAFDFAGDGQAATLAAVDARRVTPDAAGSLIISDYLASRIRRVDPFSGIITTIAGIGTGGIGDGGPASAAQLSFPNGLAFDPQGNLFIADTNNLRIRRIDGSTGIITTVAGSGTIGSIGDGGPASSATLSNPADVALDASGNLFLTEYESNRVRKVTAATRVISTVAGTGVAGFSGDGGPATAARLWTALTVKVDRNANLFIGDTFNSRIRKVTSATGVISTVAGDGQVGYGGDGGPATAAHLAYPVGMALDSSGNLFFAEFINHTVRRVDAGTGVISTVAGTGIAGFSGDGGPASSARLDSPVGVAFSPTGQLFIADGYNNRIRRVDLSTGVITTVAGNGDFNFSGDGGPATAAALNTPTGIAIDAEGNIFIADSSSRIRAVRGPPP